MKKKIIIKEDKFNRLFNNSINEITYGAIGNAELRSYDLFGELNWSFGNITSSLEEASGNFDEYYHSLIESLEKGKYVDDDGRERQNPYLSRIELLSNRLKESLSTSEDIAREIEGILDKKHDQRHRFDMEKDSIDYDKFYRDNNDPDESNYIEDNDMNYLRKNYSK